MINYLTALRLKLLRLFILKRHVIEVTQSLPSDNAAIGSCAAPYFGGKLDHVL